MNIKSFYLHYSIIQGIFLCFAQLLEWSDRSWGALGIMVGIYPFCVLLIMIGSIIYFIMSRDGNFVIKVFPNIVIIIVTSVALAVMNLLSGRFMNLHGC
jgi:hypothetical protein